jgi:hypothetical protein
METFEALLKPFPADQMRIWATSPRVNSSENNDPGIIDPMPGDKRLETAWTVAQLVKLRSLSNRLVKTL